MARTYLSRMNYDKHWRCPGWSGGGWTCGPDESRCPGGSLLVPGMWAKNGVDVVPEDGWWKWKLYRCREDCGVLALPFVTRWLDWTWWKWRVFRR